MINIIIGYLQRFLKKRISALRRICVKQKGTYNNVQDTNGELRREFAFTWGLNPAPLSSESKIALLTIDLLRKIILNIIQKVMQPPFTLTNVLIELSTVVWGGKLVVGDIYSYVNFSTEDRHCHKTRRTC